jgi:arylsulfatase A-like enzyme/uncharacterized protein HemY
MSSALLLLLALAAPAAAASQNIVLVTLDTVRADRMGFLGSQRGLTPSLDRLATRSLVFERTFSQAPITTVSHASLLSGTYPQFHRVNDFGVPLATSLPWLPELLRNAGWQTAAFVGSLILDPRAGLAPGFDRGFGSYDAGFRVRRGRTDDRYQSMERRGAEVVDRAVSWLAARPEGPFFLWVHLFDAHDPYDPAPPFASRFTKEPYDGEIAYVDAQVGRLMSALEARRLFDASLMVVCGDHGESLGEHGEKTHGVFLYDATIRVPLLVKLPGGRGAGHRINARASLVDLMPTMLEAVGLPVPQAVQGESLLPLLEEAKPKERASYAETDYPRRAFGWSSLAAWRVERFLYVKAPRVELYDLGADPDARRDIADRQATVAARIAASLTQFRDRTAGAGSADGARPLDSSLLERLAALGYVSGATAAAGSTGVDPKDRVAVANDLHDAMMLVENADYEKVIPVLERVIRSDPQIPMAQLQLGVALCRQRSYAQAVSVLRKAIALQPDAMTAHYEMGVALFETGNWKTAAAHFEIVVGRMPKFADARFSLGSVLARINRVPEAEEQLRAALELEPRHYRANLLLGRLDDLQGRPAAALPFLEAAAEAQPESAEAHAFLADALAHLGRSQDAERERAKAAALKGRRE